MEKKMTKSARFGLSVGTLLPPVFNDLRKLGSKKKNGKYEIKSARNFIFKIKTAGEIIWTIRIPTRDGDWRFDRRRGKSPVKVTPNDPDLIIDDAPGLGNGKVLVIVNKNTERRRYSYTLNLIDVSDPHSIREGNTDPSIDNAGGCEWFMKKKKNNKKSNKKR
jgi:hypothetical protein